MQIRSPYTLKRPTITPKQAVQPVVFDLASFYKQITQLTSELQAIKDKHKAEIDSQAIEFRKVLDQKTTEIKSLVSYILNIKKGEDGKNALPVNENEIIEKVVSKIPAPKNGQDAVVDYGKVAKIASTLIPPPNVDLKVIAEGVVQQIKKGKLLKTEHISNFTDGLEQTIAPIRSLAAGFRGGGDTVAAGTGITITDVNGKKVITANAASSSFLTATGTIDDSNMTFTFTSEPSLLCINGAVYSKTGGSITWTWNSSLLTVTLSVPVGINGAIFGIR